MGKLDRLLLFYASYIASYVVLYDQSRGAGGRGTDGASTSGGVC
jgi:hypothetical protein